MTESAHSGQGQQPAGADEVLARAWRTVAERSGPALVLAGTLAPDGGEPARSDPVARARDVRVAWANQAALDLLGLGPGELDAVTLPEAASRQQRGQSWPAVAASLLGGTGGAGVGVVRRIDESTQRVQVQVVPVTGGWVVLLVPHVDEARVARTAAAQAEQRFRVLAEQAPVGIFLSEAGLRLGFVNAAFAQLLGTDPGALGGTAWMDAIHHDDRGALFDVLHEVLSGVSRELQVRLEASDTVHVRHGTDGHRPAQRWLHLRLAPTTTPTRAAGFVGTAEDVTERRAWDEQMSYQVHHDPLTGLVNRRRLVAELTAALAGTRSADRGFAVLFLDLDGFKEVNDRYGHDAGDRVLVEVARRLRRTAREQDLLARIAGDEFVVVVRSVSEPKEAEAAAGRHLAALAEPFLVSGRRIALSASVGVALPAPDDTPETLLRTADRVMYLAKASGPGSYRLAPVPGAIDGPAEGTVEGTGGEVPTAAGPGAADGSVRRGSR